MDPKIPIVEVFASIQGEGFWIGTPAIFVRTGGCDFTCRWCDTPRAQLAKQIPHFSHDELIRSIESVVERLAGSPKWLVLTGGNPTLWDLTPVTAWAAKNQMAVAVETQGTNCPTWLHHCGWITVSPKGPSSGMFARTQRAFPAFMDQLFTLCGEFAEGEIKLVVASLQELDTMLSLVTPYASTGWALSIQPVTPPRDPSPTSQLAHLKALLPISGYTYPNPKLYEWSSVRFVPQLHQLLWPGQQGV